MNEEIKKRSFQEHPQYFGAFLNMARLNIFSISNHLALIFNQADLKDEETILTSFLANKNAKKLNWNRVMGALQKFMPIVKLFNNETLPKSEKEKLKAENKYQPKNDYEKMCGFLFKLFKEISDFRNDYTHYYSIENKTIRKKTVDNEIKDFLIENFDRAVEYTKTRFANVFSDEDFESFHKIKLFEDNSEITSLGLVFLTSLFLEREYAFLFIGKVTGLKGTQYKSFLAVRETFMAFCVKLPHEKFVSEDKKQALSLMIINELNKCPQTLFDVITEEQKVEFRPLLDIVAKANILENSVPEDENDYDTYIQNITKKVRNENRFAYFALKYIDEANVFNKFRFQINLGKILLSEYTKKIANEELDRQIIDKAFAFGKLNSFTDQENEILAKINRANGSIEFEQFAPHYNFNEKSFKIGISSKESNSIFINKENKAKGVLKQPVPEAFLSLNSIDKIVLLDYLKKGESEKLINDFIKINNSTILNWEFIENIKSKFADLPVFKKFSKNKKQNSAYDDEKLCELIERKNNLNKVLAQYQLNYKQIPSRIVEYWLNIQDTSNIRKFSDRIKLMKNEGKERLKNLQKNKSPKVGEMATFLAKDIVDMIISKDVKDKFTSFYYDKLQECLALYNVPEKKQMFLDICKMPEFNLFDTKKGHPFLAKIRPENIKYTTNFYKVYLEEKTLKMVETFNFKKNKTTKKDQSWMFTTFYTLEYSEKAGKKMTVVKIPASTINLPFTIKQWSKERPDLKKWFENIHGKIDNAPKPIKKPIDLPTNLFDAEIKNDLQHSLIQNQIPYNETDTNNQLFKLWWTKVKNNGFMKFYNAKREYCIYDEYVNFEIKPQGKFADYYKSALKTAFEKLDKQRETERIANKALPKVQIKQVEKVFKQTIGNTEKEIRILQEQDALMLLMFEKLLNNPNPNILENISMENILNESIDVKIEINGKLSFENEGEIIKKNENKPQISRIIVEKRKRKEFSVLQKYLHDKRLPELFEYFDKQEIPVSELKLELDTYNQVKNQVFDLVFRFEKTLIEKDYEGIKSFIETKTGEEPKNHIQHKPYLFWLKSKNFIDENEFRFLNMVRNTFSHNQFPQKKTMDLFITQWENNKFANAIFEFYKGKVENILNILM